MDSIRGITGHALIQGGGGTVREVEQGGFADTLESLCRHVDGELKEADKKEAEFAAGKRYDLHEIMVASEKAGLSLRLLMKVRNKLLEAYQEIMRMQF